MEDVIESGNMEAWMRGNVEMRKSPDLGRANISISII
jgi:hypothetical protein